MNNTTFSIHAPTYDSLTWQASFKFSFSDDAVFEETIFLQADGFDIRENMDEDILYALLQHLSIAVWVSYYKTSPANKIIIDHCKLHADQISFWKLFYTKWLGEFYYTNWLDPDILQEIIGTWEEYVKTCDMVFDNDRHLLPFGWGKDSFVTASLLQEESKDFTPFCFWKDYLIHKLWADALQKDRLLIKRSLDINKLKKTAEEWWYNGHVPITWIISFVSVMIAYLYNYSHIDFSNEKSANFGNTEYKWFTINHQWSKSLEFEDLFKQFVQQHISSSLVYASRLRWFYEIAIAKKFCESKKYLNTFSSCNKNFKITESCDDKRCNDCPKCAFVYTILRPYIDTDIVDSIRWEELYEKDSLLSTFEELRWIHWIKPLECVGTAHECQRSSFEFLKRNPKFSSKSTDVFIDKIRESQWSKYREDLELKLFS